MTKSNPSQLYELIKQRFKPPAWITFSEVSDGTGVNIARYADAIAMAIWPSRGYDLNGFEIKVSRSDWLKELNDPAKSWPIQRFCDAWWIIAADETIVKDGELPKTWGLMVPKGGKLKVVSKAPALKPERLDRAFVASILRRQYQCQEALIQKEIEKRHGANDLARHKAIELERRVEVLEEDKNRLQGSLDDFERVSGIKITKWNGERLGGLLNQVRNLQDPKRVIEWFKKAEASAAEVQEQIKAHRDILDRLSRVDSACYGRGQTGVEAFAEWKGVPSEPS